MCKIAFIGGGSMAEAMISGITTRGDILPSQLTVMNRNNLERLNFLHSTYGVRTTTSLESLCKDATIVILAVKPKDVFTALSSIKPFLHDKMLLISVVAGVSIANIETITNQQLAIIRTMPNTSATVGMSATAIALNSYVSNEQLQTASAILETIGSVTLVEEEHLDAVTGLSGSGPAYIYYLIEAMEESAKEIGLEKEAAKNLILQTIIGAAEMLLHSPKSPQTLRKEVTSPGGTTEAGVNVLQEREVKAAIVECIIEATQQSKKLGQKLTDEINTKSISIN